MAGYITSDSQKFNTAEEAMAHERDLNSPFWQDISRTRTDLSSMSPATQEMYRAGQTVLSGSTTDRRTAENGFGTGLGLGDETSSEYDTLSKSLYDESQKTLSREEIRANVLADYQAQINAVNALYDNLVAAEETPAKNRLGMTRATRAAGGLLGGSPRGEFQTEQTTQYNKSIVETINAKRSNAINEIFGKVNELTMAELDKQEEAKKTGAKDYLTYLSTTQERKKTNASTILQSLLDQGMTPEDLTEEELKYISDGLQLSPQATMNIFKGEFKKLQDAAQAASDKAEAEAKTSDIKEYEYAQKNGFTGSYIEWLKQSSAATRAPKVGGAGTGNDTIAYYVNGLLDGRITSETSVPQALRVKVNDVVNQVDDFVKQVIGSTGVQVTPDEQDIIIEEILNAFSDIGLDEASVRAMIDASFNSYRFNPFGLLTGGTQYQKGAARRVKK